MYNADGTVSKDTLVSQHAGLVKRLAYHLAARLPPSVAVDDLIQAGMIGLLDASHQYDETQGASFETYASIRIRGAMLDELRRNDWAPKSVHRKARDLADALQRVEAATGREATDEEVVAEMGVDYDEYYRILRDANASRILSFDDLGIDDYGLGGSNAEEMAPHRRVEDEDFRRNLAGAIQELPERERLILALYYDEELNLKEIGAVLKVSESRVSQLLSRAHLRLRGQLQDWTGA